MEGEPKDICCICQKPYPARSLSDVNSDDFELLCKNCKECRCTNCNFLRSKMKLGIKRYFCRFVGSILYPNKRVCEHWRKLQKNYSEESTKEDY
jgi:hypothetical protein